MLFKVRRKNTSKVYTVYDIHYAVTKHDDCSQILIYDNEEEHFNWEYIKFFEPVE